MPRKSTTRAAQGAGSIRKKTVIRNGQPYVYWEARYTAGINPGTGKQIQKSISGKTQAEVRKRLQEIAVSIDQGTFLEPSKQTVGEWLDLWVEEYTVDLKPHTLNTYQTRIKRNIKPALGAVKLQALSAAQIQKLYNGLSRGTNGQKGLAPKTIKCVHGVLHKALQQAVELGYIHFNPADACKLPRVERAEIKPLEEKEITAFLKAISGHPLERLYTVDLFTGMRQGEILGLTWDCVDFKEGTILVCKQLIKEKQKGGQYLLASLKNDKSRRLTPAPSVMKALQDQKRVQTEQRLKAGALWSNPLNLVFTNELGRHLVHMTVYKQYKRIVESIGVPEARFHDLRHSYAVAALQSGDSIKTVQEALGHATAAFTMDVYAHVSETMKKESAARMEAFIKGVKGA